MASGKSQTTYLQQISAIDDIELDQKTYPVFEPLNAPVLFMNVQNSLDDFSLSFMLMMR